MTPLYQEIHRWRGLPFQLGHTDCVLVLCDWVHRVKGHDPAAHIRGMYDDWQSCERVTGWVRDPVGAVDALWDTIGGLPRTQRPRPGDVAVIHAPSVDRFRPAGALWMGACWACKSRDGAVTLALDAVPQVMAIWSVGYEA